MLAVDRDVLRDLARRVREAAQSPEQVRRREQALAINRLTAVRPTRAVIPEGAWPEVLDETSLQCADPTCRQWERELRQRLIHHEVFKDDTPISDLLLVDVVAHLTDWGVEIPTQQVESRGSYHWDPPLKNLDADLLPLRKRRWTCGEDATRQRMDCARELFGNLLTVAPQRRGFWTMGLTWDAIKLYGMEPFMMAMYDDPDGVHRLMGFLRDDLAGVMDDMAAARVLHSRNSVEHVASGGVGLTHDLPSADPRSPDYRYPVDWRERWGFAESQETVGVSPDMFTD